MNYFLPLPFFPTDSPSDSSADRSSSLLFFLPPVLPTPPLLGFLFDAVPPPSASAFSWATHSGKHSANVLPGCFDSTCVLWSTFFLVSLKATAQTVHGRRLAFAASETQLVAHYSISFGLFLLSCRRGACRSGTVRRAIRTAVV